MLVARRGGPDSAVMLLVCGLAAALLANVRTQPAADVLDRSSALTTCLNTTKASVQANGSWQSISATNVGLSRNVQCTLSITTAVKDSPSAAHAHPTSSTKIQLRLLFRIDQLQFQKPTQEAATCTKSSSSISLSRHLRAWSMPLCDSMTDRYAWFNDSLDVLILASSKNPILWINATFAALPAINACEDGRRGTVALAVESAVYVYVPDQLYNALLWSGSVCEMNRNYTVQVRAANASRLLLVTVLAAPSAPVSGCSRLHVERCCLVANDSSSSDEPVEIVTIVYELLGSCRPPPERVGFTVKLESVSSTSRCSTEKSDSSSTLRVGSRRPPELNGSTSTMGSRSPTLTATVAAVGSTASMVTTLVASLVALLVVSVIIAIVTVAVRKLKRRDGRRVGRVNYDRGESRSAPSGGTVAGRRGKNYPSVLSHCLRGNSFDSGCRVSADEEMSMIDNDLYAAPRIEKPVQLLMIEK